MSDARLDYFNFISSYVTLPLPLWAKIPLFLVFYFIFSNIALFIIFTCNLKTPNLNLPNWWILSLFGSLAIGIAMAFLFYVQGGSGAYFSNLPMFISLPLILCLPQFYPSLFDSKNNKIKFMFIFLLIGQGLPPIGYGLYKYIDGMTQVTPQTDMETYIEKLKAISNDETSLDAVVYIPRNEIFWDRMNAIPTNYSCRATTYIIPAISERPALYSWPTNACYDFLCGPRFHSNGLCEQSTHIYSDQELLDEARHLGFNKVYLVTKNNSRLVE